MNRKSRSQIVCAIAVVLAAVIAVMSPRVLAQGVTTGMIAGVVADAQGAVVPGATVVAVHQPSGTSYESISQADGRFALPGLRVVDLQGDRGTAGFATEAKEVSRSAWAWRPTSSQTEGRRGCRRSDRDSDIRSGVQHEPHGRGNGDNA
jgi:hypothetical protein